MALLVAASLGGMVAIALAASEAPSFPRTQVSASLSAVNPATSLPWIDPELTAHLEAQDDAPVRIIVVLDTPSVDPVERLSVASAATLAQARTTFVAEKQVRFTQAVRAIEPVFDAARERDLLGERRDLWLVDAVALTAHPALVRELATLPGVAEVHLDHYRQYVDPPTDLLGMDFVHDIAPDRGRPTGASPRTAAQDAEVYMLNAGERPWGLDEVRAPEVWHTLGVSGTGAVVAVVDTGVDWQHPDLIDGYRGNVGKRHLSPRCRLA